MEWSVLKMLLNSLTLQKQKKVLSDDRVRPVLDCYKTRMLYDIRLNPAEDLTAARGIMGSKNSLPNFAMKKESSDPHQNTVTQNALLLAPQRRCASMSNPLTNMKKDSSDPHQNTVTQNALLLALQRRCQSMDRPIFFTLKRNDPHQNTVTQNALLLAPQRLCSSIELPPKLPLDRNDTSDSS